MATPFKVQVTQSMLDRANAAAPANDNVMLDIAELKTKMETRLAGMETARWSWWSYWRDISKWIQPRLGRFLETPNEASRGRPKNQRIIDDVATTSSQRCAAGLMAGVTSPARAWYQLGLADGTPPEGSPAKRWLGEVQRRQQRVLNESNFYRSIATLYEEIVVFGTGVMLVYEDFQDIVRFYPLAAGQYYLGLDDRLDPSTLARKIAMTTVELVGRFGLRACPSEVVDAYKNGFHDQEWMVAHMIMPNDRRVTGAIGPAGQDWIECYWIYGRGGSDVLEVKGYHERPFVAARWNVTGNDPYGRAPGMDALGHVKQLQTVQKRKAQVEDKLANPPMVADITLKNQPATTIPGAVTYLAARADSVQFKPAYQVHPEAVAVMVADIKEIQNRIKTVFFEDLFLMVSQLDTVRTATEVAERKEEKMLMLGPALERLHDELLRPVIMRLFAIMQRGRVLPPMPQEIANQAPSIEFISTLAQAQKAVATAAIERIFAFAGNIAAVKPEIMDKLDSDAAIDEYADAIGVPPSLVVSTEQVAQLRAARAKQAQQQQALQTTVAGAQSAKVLSETNVGGGMNALQRITGLAA